jgi:branched-chain amino acid transport system ATP-binding protein
MLKLCSVYVSFGKVEVLRGLDMHVREREIVALLGPNGCGKSTTLRSISGLVSPKAGSIQFRGVDVCKRSIRERVRMGVTLVPQGRTLFNSMTVEENLLMGAFARTDGAEINRDREFWLEFFPGMNSWRGRLAGQLSGGEQRMVAVARGMMSRPSLALLDEPSLGVAPKVLIELGAVIRRVRDEMGLTVVLVEQDVPFAMSVADRILVLSGGRIALDDKPEALKDGKRLHDVYFGQHTTNGNGA